LVERQGSKGKKKRCGKKKEKLLRGSTTSGRGGRAPVRVEKEGKSPQGKAREWAKKNTGKGGKEPVKKRGGGRVTAHPNGDEKNRARKWANMRTPSQKGIKKYEKKKRSKAENKMKQSITMAWQESVPEEEGQGAEILRAVWREKKNRKREKGSIKKHGRN